LNAHAYLHLKINQNFILGILKNNKSNLKNTFFERIFPKAIIESRFDFNQI